MLSVDPRDARHVPEMTARVVRAAFPKGSLCIRIRDALGPLFEDAEFAEAFPARGRPAVSPGALALVSVLQYVEGLTDRQAAEQVRARMDWKYLLGLELDDPGFDFTVLSTFRTRLLAHGLEERVFDSVLNHLSARGLLRSGGRQRTDSTHVLAGVRTLNRLELVGEVLRAALNALAAVEPGWLGVLVTPEWFDRYSAKSDAYRLPKGEQARVEYALTVGRDGFTLLQAVYATGAPAGLRQIPAVETMRRVWVQQYLRQGEEVIWREAGDLPPARLRISSPYDLHARYSVKRDLGWCGYKTHLSETCEPRTLHVITNVETTPATTTDVEVTSDIHAHLVKRGLRPDEHVVDTGYTSVDLMVGAAKEHGIALFGPLRADTSNQNKKNEGFDRSRFTIDWDHRQVTCPQGKTSGTWSGQRKASGIQTIQVFFPVKECRACPVQQQCTRPGSRHGRQLTLLPREHQQVLDQTRRDQETEEWKQRYAIRAGIEGTVSQAVRGTGIRRTRYVGLPKTHLGNVLAATAINVVRLDAWLTETPQGLTRTSHFAQLATAA